MSVRPLGGGRGAGRGGRCVYPKWKWKLLNHVQLFGTPWTIQVHGILQATGVGSLSLLQGIFPTQGSSPGLLYCRQILYQLSHKGSPRILEWVACPFSSQSSWRRNCTGVSCIAGGFFTNWAIREARVYPKVYHKCWGQRSLVHVNIHKVTFEKTS